MNAKGIWVYIEQFENKALDISWELLGISRKLADKSNQELIALVIGDDVEQIAEEAIHRGADRVYLIKDRLLNHYKYESYSSAAYNVLSNHKPMQLIIGATPNGRELAGRLAIKLKTGLNADVVSLDTTEDGLMIAQVPGFGGSILAVIKCETARPQMATVRLGVFDPLPVDTSRKGEIHRIDLHLKPEDFTTKLLKLTKVEGVNISKAKRLVAVGRGMGQDISALKELASLIDADIGATRPICDDGILPREHQVGSTGITVKPDLVINFGISGAAHYTAGISKSKTVISINTDPEATIFEYTDYKVHGDAQKILPLLVEKLKAKMQQEVMA
jgi:electron transfer flavoprotein alpha subunit